MMLGVGLKDLSEQGGQGLEREQSGLALWYQLLAPECSVLTTSFWSPRQREAEEGLGDGSH